MDYCLQYNQRPINYFVRRFIVAGKLVNSKESRHLPVTVSQIRSILRCCMFKRRRTKICAYTDQEWYRKVDSVFEVCERFCRSLRDIHSILLSHVFLKKKKKKKRIVFYRSLSQMCPVEVYVDDNCKPFLEN